jgi:cytoskeletal protein CcmA (bactofilin family)
VKLQGRFHGGIDVNHLLVEKKSDVEFSRPVKARAVEIHGKVTARIICSGCVTIVKSGELAGSVHAKSVNFEKGGLFNGDLVIGQDVPGSEIEAQNENAEGSSDDGALHLG